MLKLRNNQENTYNYEFWITFIQEIESLTEWTENSILPQLLWRHNCWRHFIRVKKKFIIEKQLRKKSFAISQEVNILVWKIEWEGGGSKTENIWNYLEINYSPPTSCYL